MSAKSALIEGTAIVSALAASAGAATGAVLSASGDVKGAPGVSRSLSRLGKVFGGGMITGVAVIAGTATLLGIAVYQSLRQLK